MANMVIKGLSYKDYSAMEGLTNSALNKIAISPAHYKLSIENPTEETEATKFGTLLHCLVLEPDNFEKTFAIEPIVNKRTNEGKEILSQFYEENSDKTVITEDQYNLAVTLKEKLFEHDIAKKLLTGKGENEIALFWEDEELGIKCKAKLDRVISDIIIDLKTTRSAKPEHFIKSVIEYGYHRQSSWYCKGFEKCFSKKPKGFVFIAIEKEPPYSVCVFEVSELLKEIGRIEIEKLLPIYKECKETNNFYSYDGAQATIHTLDPPIWLIKKYSNELGIDEEEVMFNE